MESHPMYRLKNPTVAFNLQNQCVQCTPAHYPREILRIGTLTEGPLCSESHPMCRLKDPTVVYMITCFQIIERTLFCNRTAIDKVQRGITNYINSYGSCALHVILWC